MNKKSKTLLALSAGLLAIGTLAGCTSDANVVSENLSREADQFEIQRRIVFYNGINGDYMLVLEGRCSIEAGGGQLEVVCKLGPDQYKKHFLGLSDNVTYFAEQLESADVSEYHYNVIWKPEQILPITIDPETKAEDGAGH